MLNRLNFYLLLNCFQEHIFETYKSIKFRPEHFTEYLLSSEVGFESVHLLGTPYNKSKGKDCFEDRFRVGTYVPFMSLLAI